ncbi:hypothetical protein HDU84_005888 [Entophlyctis sp. JEL0112]|nr:hypothetical protein HDU84_005888 [Entophlyctis sp. JEL0112]
MSSAVLEPFQSPVSPALFFPLSVLSLSAGFVFASLLLIHELGASKVGGRRSVVYELSTAVPSSLLLGAYNLQVRLHSIDRFAQDSVLSCCLAALVSTFKDCILSSVPEVTVNSAETE